jgi:hypothetical protein
MSTRIDECLGLYKNRKESFWSADIPGGFGGKRHIMSFIMFLGESTTLPLGPLPFLFFFKLNY